MRRYFWISMSIIMLIPAANIFWLIDKQLSLWMFIVDIPKGDSSFLVLSVLYWPVLLLLTSWYWIWRTARWIFDDEGPLPRFRAMLLIMWAPVYIIPLIVIISALGWLGCLFKAHEEG